MKTKLTMLIAVLVLVIVIVFLAKPNKPTYVIPDAIATERDSAITDSVKTEIALKDSIINKLELQLNSTNQKTKQLKKVNGKLKIGVDSLTNFYNLHHNLTTCDSLVNSQRIYIDSLEEEIDSLDVEAMQYSKLLFVERGKSEDKDITIQSKITLISAYKQQIERINCMDEWTKKHKFWSWILGIKCK